MIDRMLQASVRTVLPMHWTQQTPKTIVRKTFAKNAVDICESRHGVSIPLRGPSNGMWAVLIAVSNESAMDWERRRYEIAKDLFYIANYIHQRVSRLYAREEQVDLKAITKREIEALSWAAEGKTLADMATLMRISVQTVKAHLDAARFKLGSLNRVHAVTKAFRAGLIS